jgi:hypothetical protein
VTLGKSFQQSELTWALNYIMLPCYNIIQSRIKVSFLRHERPGMGGGGDNEETGLFGRHHSVFRLSLSILKVEGNFLSHK